MSDSDFLTALLDGTAALETRGERVLQAEVERLRGDYDKMHASRDRVCRERREFRLRAEQAEAHLAEVLNAPPAQMTTPLGLLPVNSDGMRKVVDRLRKVVEVLGEILRWAPDAVDNIERLTKNKFAQTECQRLRSVFRTTLPALAAAQPEEN